MFEGAPAFEIRIGLNYCTFFGITFLFVQRVKPLSKNQQSEITIKMLKIFSTFSLPSKI